MTDSVVWVDLGELKRFVVDVFKTLRVPEDEAEICSDVLINADERGIDSHGINRLKPIYYDRIMSGIQSPVTDFEIVKDGHSTAIVDGHHGMGQVIAKRAMELCIEKARKFDTGMVVVRNSTHFGIAGYYVMMAVEANMIGIAGTNARPSVAPTYGIENMLGTNPLTFGFPTDEDFPFVLDCATSITQRGKIEEYARKGKKLPDGLVIGLDGKYMTEPEEILMKLLEGEASILPLGGVDEVYGGHKGYGYSTVVEVLSSALQGGAFLRAVTGVNVGHFFMSIDISAFTELALFKKTAGDIMRSLRNSKRIPEEDRIYTAGEKEYLTSIQRRMKGVPLNLSIQREITQMMNELSLSGYDFPFVED